MRAPFIALVVAGLLAGCASTSAQKSTTPPELGGEEQIEIGEAPPSSPSEVKIPSAQAVASETGIESIRRNALIEAAQTYGSRMGYASQSWNAMNDMKGKASVLSQAFDFNRVAVRAPGGAGIVMPPVVSTGTGAFTVSDNGQEAAVSDAYLTVVTPGKFVSVVPTWRNYLIMPVTQPETPVSELLPRDEAERALYSRTFQSAWDAGINQANSEFQERVNRLERDYRGMLQYIRLVNQGMMDEMVISSADFGVTTDDGEMRIGSRAVKITSEAKFNGNPRTWSVSTLRASGALVADMGVVPGIGNQTK